MNGDRFSWSLDSIYENQYKNKLLYKRTVYYKNLNKPILRSTFLYYPDNRLKEKYTENYNSFANTFEPSSRSIFSYKDSTEYYSNILYLYDKENSVWIKSRYNICKKDQFNNTYSNQTYSLNGPDFTLVENYSFKRKYLQSNTNKDTLLDKVYSYESIYTSYGTVSSESKWDAEYDKNDRISKLITYSNIGLGIDHIDSFDYNNTKNLIPVRMYRTERNNNTYLYDSLAFKTKFNEGFFTLNDASHYVLSYTLNNRKIFRTRKRTMYPDSNGSSITFFENFNTNNNSWEYSSCIYRLYNEDRKIIDNYSANFSLTTNKFVPFDGFKYELIYDSNGFLRDSIVRHIPLNSSAFENYVKFQHYNYELLTSIYDEENSYLSIYPNPSPDGTINIKYDSQKEITLKIDVLDINGKTIVKQQYKTTQGNNTIELNGLNRGMYFVMITSEDGVSRSKLIVK